MAPVRLFREVAQSRRARVSPLGLIAFAAVVWLVGGPVYALIYTSLHTAPLGSTPAEFTLTNWQALLGPELWTPLRNTLLLSSGVTIFSVLLGCALAWLVHRTDAPFSRAFEWMFVMPMLFSPLLTSVGWIVLGSPFSGIINTTYFHLFPHATDPIFDIYSMTGMIFLMALHDAPYAYLLVLGTAQGIEGNLIDGSRAAGAGVFTTLRRIELPLLRPAIVSSALLIFAISAEELSVPVLIGTPARIPTIQQQILQAMTDFPGTPTYAATLGSLLMSATVIGTLLYNRALRASQRYVTVSGKPTTARLVRLGHWKVIAFLFCTLYLLLALVIPYVAVIFGSLLKYITPDITVDLLTLDNYVRIASISGVARAIQTTYVLALVGSSVILAVGLLLTIWSTRTHSVLARVAGFLAMVPLFMPGLVLGLGVLWINLWARTGIYGTPIILILAYTTRLMPFGLRGLSARFLQIDPELALAARVHGASSLRAMSQIVVPLLRPAVLGTWTLLFIIVTLEFSQTSLLYTAPTATAAIVIWQQFAYGDQGVAFAVSAVMATSSLALLLIGQRLFGLLKYSSSSVVGRTVQKS